MQERGIANDMNSTISLNQQPIQIKKPKTIAQGATLRGIPNHIFIGNCLAGHDLP